MSSFVETVLRARDLLYVQFEFVNLTLNVTASGSAQLQRVSRASCLHRHSTPAAAYRRRDLQQHGSKTLTLQRVACLSAASFRHPGRGRPPTVSLRYETAMMISSSGIVSADTILGRSVTDDVFVSNSRTANRIAEWQRKRKRRSSGPEEGRCWRFRILYRLRQLGTVCS
jgi:hypothetical protein